MNWLIPELIKSSQYSESNLPLDKINHNELSYSYIIRQDGNKVTLQYRANVNTPFISPEQYEELCNFWEDMVNRNNQRIVLKKTLEVLWKDFACT